jgi:hypothetical protein
MMEQQPPQPETPPRVGRLVVRTHQEEKEDLLKLAQEFGYAEVSTFIRELRVIFERFGVQPSPGELTGNN